ncbi:MAG: sigma-70 family RNA polymerase sigma factor [Anaerolineales bacterium]|nr:sigma-70 family RNA polymerase sigma factor [Anaerolineales bacterium]
MNPKAQTSNYVNNMKATSSPSDLDLIRQIAVKDQGALEELYQRYHRHLFRFFMRTTHEQTSGEDLLQEFFINVWEGAARFEGRSSVKTWMFRMAYFMAAGWVRNNKVHFEDVENDSFELLMDQDEPSLESQVFTKWNYSQIQNAIEELSPNHREIVDLSFFYGLTHIEIAHVLACPVGTVKSRLHSALRQLNRILCAKGIKK